MLEILTYPDPRLNLIAKPVTEFNSKLKHIVDQMFAIMHQKEGCGLASIQVNIQKSIIVLDISRDYTDPKVLINTKILSASGSQNSEEGCLSFPGIRINVKRPKELVVQAQDIHGNTFTLEASDFLARCIHHECEHLAGEVFIKDLSRLKLHMALKKLEKHKKYHAE